MLNVMLVLTVSITLTVRLLGIVMWCNIREYV